MTGAEHRPDEDAEVAEVGIHLEGIGDKGEREAEAAVGGRREGEEVDAEEDNREHRRSEFRRPAMRPGDDREHRRSESGRPAWHSVEPKLSDRGGLPPDRGVARWHSPACAKRQTGVLALAGERQTDK